MPLFANLHQLSYVGGQDDVTLPATLSMGAAHG